MNISWSETQKDYILRIHLGEEGKYFQVEDNTSSTGIKSHESFESFQMDSVNSYFFDKTKGNLWIRKNNPGISGSLSVVFE